MRHSLALGSILLVTVVGCGASRPPATVERAQAAVVQSTWEFVGAPPPRENGAMVYDAERGRVILFGGNAANHAPLGDTWEWNGATWMRMPFAGPPARARHAMAYDPVRKRVVMYGGDLIPATFGGDADLDVWEYDGTRWEPIAASLDGLTADESLVDHGMAYDPTQGRVLVSGGRLHVGQMSQAYTWSWNGVAFTLLDDESPVATPGGRSCLTTANGTVVRQQPLASGVFHWDGGGWVPTVDAPFFPVDCTSAYDAERDSLVTLGQISPPNAGTWELSAFMWTQVGPLAPEVVGLDGATMVWDAARRRLVVFGGSLTASHFERVGTQWFARTSVRPEPRQPAAWAVDSWRGQVIMFGGCTAGPGTALADTWSWDGTRWTLIATGGPPAVCHAGMDFDEETGAVVMIPRTGANVFNAWRLVDSTWTSVPIPGIYESPALVRDPARDRFVVFSDVGELLEWDGASNLFEGPTAIIPSFDGAVGRSAAVYSPAHGGVFVLGTDGVPTLYQGVYDGNTFTPITTTTMPATQVQAHALTFDALRDHIVMFGGRLDGTVSNQVWELGTNWELAPGNPPPARAGNLLAYDPIHQNTIVFGGTDGVASLGDTWALRMLGGECTSSVQCPSGHCVDGVCCNDACAGSCQACSVAKGAAQDGTCQTLVGGHVGRMLCGGFICDGRVDCRVDCGTDAHCASGFVCFMGECTGLAPQGGACSAAVGCLPGLFCAEGVCCDAACEGVCQGCAEPGSVGTCTVRATPRPGECTGDPGCAGSCTGATASEAACAYPMSDTPCGSECALCDGQGACAVMPVEDARCAGDARECGVDGECFRFVREGNLACEAVNLCEQSGGACARQNIADETPCSDGVCRQGACVAAPPPGGGCTVSTSAQPRGFGAAAALALLIAGVARRLRRRRQTARLLA